MGDRGRAFEALNLAAAPDPFLLKVEGAPSRPVHLVHWSTEGSTTLASPRFRVEVARNRELFAQEFSRGIPQGPVAKLGPTNNRRGTTVTFHADAGWSEAHWDDDPDEVRLLLEEAAALGSANARTALSRLVADDASTPDAGSATLPVR